MAIFKPTKVLPAPGTPVTKTIDFSAEAAVAADGTVDGTGKVIGDGSKDYRNHFT